MKDVSVGFGLPKLNETLLHKEKGYARGTDYKLMFNRSAAINYRHESIKYSTVFPQCGNEPIKLKF